MPELPDVTIYVEALESRIRGQVLRALRLANPFVLRSVEPPVSIIEGRTVESIERIGKRIAIGLAGDCWVVIHLMIAGRFRWLTGGKKPPGKLGLAALEFDGGTLWLTEAGTKRRASIHLVAGRAGLAQFGRGGLEPLTIDQAAFADRLRSENHTLKRALTDPRLFSGIGNAYSDEILHAARLSPLQLTHRLEDEEVVRLYLATRDILLLWINRLRQQAGGNFPEGVTAFREEMAVHGRYGKPCPVCGTPVQRIRYADNETNYCARCQTGGRLLADRAMSRLLKDDWPRSIDEL
ncbi:MAG TPA: DNA-formamidopyrimidine glycosylase family protein [Gemmatimonadales bacterium]|nr:DNA-formamidopyrimidine glycosylase family protein [Gemmatimonadales bacterium]